MSAILTELSRGVEGIFLPDTRFSTTLISFNFYLPLSAETVAENALLPFLLTTGCKKYPDFSKLNYKLNKLYGAHLDAHTEKIGDLQLLRISVSTIDDRFALDGEALCAQACELLEEMIFAPNVENQAFTATDVEREKRKAIEHIRGEIADKRTYAKRRLIEEMYRGVAYGVSECGTEADVAALNGAVLFRAWQRMLQQSFVRVIVSAATLPQGLFDTVARHFEAVDRHDITDCFCHTGTPAAAEVRTVNEYMDLTQGKLCMGFSSTKSGSDDDTAALYVMCDIFGGGPYSRLFENVREKMSLCYYCSAGITRLKGLLTVSSGVERENVEKAQAEILNQLAIVQAGKFEDFEFESALKSLRDSLIGAADGQRTLNLWYALKIANRALLSPEDFAEKISAVTRQEVIEAANAIQLHTVYRLLPKE